MQLNLPLVFYDILYDHVIFTVLERERIHYTLITLPNIYAVVVATQLIIPNYFVITRSILKGQIEKICLHTLHHYMWLLTH